MKFLAYVRGSRETVDVENQTYAIQKWAEEHRHEIVKVFPDEGVSGWKIPPKERPHFKEMLEYSEATGIKNVVVYSVDRLSRHFWDGLEILRFFEEEGFNVEFTNDPWFSNTPPDMRKVMMALMFWTAEMYAKSVSEKMKTKIQRVKVEDADPLNVFDSGWGQGKLYRKDGEISERRKITPELFTRIAQLRRIGYSWQRIADRLEFKNKTVPYNAWRRIGKKVEKLMAEGHTIKEIAEHSGVPPRVLRQVLEDIGGLNKVKGEEDE